MDYNGDAFDHVLHLLTPWPSLRSIDLSWNQLTIYPSTINMDYYVANWQVQLVGNSLISRVDDYLYITFQTGMHPAVTQLASSLQYFHFNLARFDLNINGFPAGIYHIILPFKTAGLKIFVIFKIFLFQNLR